MKRFFFLRNGCGNVMTNISRYVTTILLFQDNPLGPKMLNHRGYYGYIIYYIMRIITRATIDNKYIYTYIFLN